MLSSGRPQDGRSVFQAASRDDTCRCPLTHIWNLWPHRSDLKSALFLFQKHVVHLLTIDPREQVVNMGFECDDVDRRLLFFA